MKLADQIVQEYQEILTKVSYGSCAHLRLCPQYVFNRRPLTAGGSKIDNYYGAELGKLIVDHEIKSPTTGGALEPPVSFNLMFQTSIGPSANLPG